MSDEEGHGLPLHLVRKYKDVELPNTGALIVQKKGPWLGIGYVLEMRGGIFHVDWAPKDKNPISLPYEIERAKYNFGSGIWGVIKE